MDQYYLLDDGNGICKLTHAPPQTFLKALTSMGIKFTRVTVFESGEGVEFWRFVPMDFFFQGDEAAAKKHMCAYERQTLCKIEFVKTWQENEAKSEPSTQSQAKTAESELATMDVKIQLAEKDLKILKLERDACHTRTLLAKHNAQF